MIAIKKNKTPTQVILRYLIQNGCCAIPKSTDKNRIDENINIFDFELDEDEMKILDSLNTGDRTVPFTLCESHKHFMFNIEF